MREFRPSVTPPPQCIYPFAGAAQPASPRRTRRPQHSQFDNNQPRVLILSRRPSRHRVSLPSACSSPTPKPSVWSKQQNLPHSLHEAITQLTQMSPLLILFVASTLAQTCYDRFPLKETVSTVKQLVQQYGKSVNETDSDGTQWINVLLGEKTEGYKQDDVTYFLNDNSLPPENTFYFDQLQFLSTPSFVVKSISGEWSASHPDNTLLLSKISFTCPIGQRACGLRCCPEINYLIQKLLVEKAKTTPSGKIEDNESVEHDDVIYSTSARNSSCSYTFSYHDSIVRKAMREQELTIYFNCPTDDGCCGLSCSQSPQSELSRSPRSNSDLATVFYLENRHVILLGGCLVFLSLFAVVTTLNYRQHRRSETTGEAPPLRTSHETQTSTISLEKEALFDV